jgi:radical SAM enzyme (TIGR01210 family)
LQSLGNASACGENIAVGREMRSGVILPRDQLRALRQVLLEVTRTEELSAALVFGSWARSSGAPVSDLDLILLLRQPRSERFLRYNAWLQGEVHVDLNLLTVQEANALLSEFRWQYRFADVVIADYQRPVPEETARWLRIVGQWVRSPAAGRYRQCRIAEVIEAVLVALAKAPLEFKGYREHLLAELLCLCFMLTTECGGSLPFALGNPIETALRHKGCTAYKPRPSDFITSLSGAGVAHLRQKWLALKEALSRGRRVLATVRHELSEGADEAAVAASLTGSEANEISPRLARVYELSGLLDAFGSGAEAWGQACMAARKGKTNARAIDLPSLVPRRTTRVILSDAPRERVWSKDRRRLKVILPTGGCHVPGCSFCALPSLAPKSMSRDWSRMLRCRAASVNELVVYTDGSFFDDRELSELDREHIAGCVSRLGARRLIVESLPCFVTQQKIDRVIAALGPHAELRVGIGVQSSNTSIRRTILGTPISESELLTVFRLRSQSAFQLRVYLLFGKPLLTVEEDYNDVFRSVDDLAPFLGQGDVVTVNMLRVARGTAVAWLSRRNLYESGNLCVLRRLIAVMRQRDYTFEITPGCIGVRTCAPMESAGPTGCTVCRRSLKMAEVGRHVVDQKECHLGTGMAGLPWALFGPLERRCEFVKDIRGGTFHFDVLGATEESGE